MIRWNRISPYAYWLSWRLGKIREFNTTVEFPGQRRTKSPIESRGELRRVQHYGWTVELISTNNFVIGINRAQNCFTYLPVLTTIRMRWSASASFIFLLSYFFTGAEQFRWLQLIFFALADDVPDVVSDSSKISLSEWSYFRPFGSVIRFCNAKENCATDKGLMWVHFSMAKFGLVAEPFLCFHSKSSLQ